MKQNLLAVTLALILGFLVMITPAFIWHQKYFPEKALTLYTLREETMNHPQPFWGGLPAESSRWCLWSNGDSISTFPLYLSLLSAFLVSISVYLVSKMRS